MTTLTVPFSDALLKGDVDWRALSLKLVMARNTYVFDPVAPTPVLPAHINASADMTGLDVVAGFAQADPVPMSAHNPNHDTTQLLIVDAVTMVPYLQIDEAPYVPVRPLAALFWVVWQGPGIFTP